MEKLNIAIADDNERIVNLLGSIIREDEDLELVGQADNGKDIYNIIKEKEPDVVLLDIIMPKVDGPYGDGKGKPGPDDEKTSGLYCGVCSEPGADYRRRL